MILLPDGIPQMAIPAYGYLYRVVKREIQNPICKNF